MRHNFAQIWTGTIATNGVILLIGVVTGILTARLLGPAGRGELALVIFWPSLIASIGMLSLPSAIVYLNGPIKPEFQTNLVSSVICISLALAALAAGLGYVFLPFFIADPQLLQLCRAYMVAFIPFNFIGLSLLAFDQSQLKFLRFNILRLIPPVTLLIALVIVWSADMPSVPIIVWATWTGTFLTAVLCFSYYRKLLRALPTLSAMRSLCISAARFHGGTMLALLFSHADRIVVVTNWNHRDIGLYVVAYTLATAGVQAVSSSFRDILFPRLANAEDPASSVKLIAQAMRYAMVLLTAGAVVLAFACPVLVPLLFGGGYSDAVSICIVLLLAFIPAGLRDIVTKSLRGIGDWSTCLAAESISLGGFVVAFLGLQEHLGLLSVPISLLIANIIGFAYLSWALYRRYAIPLHSCWGLNFHTIREILGKLMTMLRTHQ